MGLDLLEHLDWPGVVDVLAELAEFTVRAMNSVALPPGLLTGRTGVDVFLRRLDDLGIVAGFGYSGVAFRGPDWKSESDDLIAGVSGVGLGHLAQHLRDGDLAHLAVAERCTGLVLEHAPPSRRRISFGEHTAVDSSAGRAHGMAGTPDLPLPVRRRRGGHPRVEAPAGPAPP